MPMEGHVQHRWVIFKDVLRAVPMVDVPVQDDDSSGTCSLGCLGSNCRVVEEAEPHGHAALGVVACDRKSKTCQLKIVHPMIFCED